MANRIRGIREAVRESRELRRERIGLIKKEKREVNRYLGFLLGERFALEMKIPHEKKLLKKYDRDPLGRKQKELSELALEIHENGLRIVNKEIERARALSKNLTESARGFKRQTSPLRLMGLKKK